MPTPFMHIDFAEQMLAHPDLFADTRQQLIDQLPAFYFGSVAPDFQAICDVPREATHFYPIPLLPEHDPVGFDLLLEQHPALQSAAALPPALAIFLAGYGAHLLLDVIFYREVLLPYFWLSKRWGNAGKRQRVTVNFTLLTWLDQQAFTKVPSHSAETLGAAPAPEPLSFIDNTHLDSFRAFLVEQLVPGAPIHTVQVYADRLEIPREQFAANLADPEWMQNNVFALVPPNEVAAIFEAAIGRCVTLLNSYLSS